MQQRVQNNMIRNITSAVVLLTLVSCGTPTPEVIVRDKPQVIIPDAALFVCPTLKKWPKSTTLTDVQVAKVLRTLYLNNKTCANSLNAVEQFLDNSKTTIESDN